GQHHVALDVALGCAKENMDIPTAIDECLRSTARAGPGRSLERRLLGAEMGAIVVRAGDPEPAPRLARSGIRTGRVPGDKDVSLGIGADGAAAVEVKRPVHQVPLRLERTAIVAHARVEHRDALDRVWRGCLLRSVPRDVNAAVSAKRKLAASDRAH